MYILHVCYACIYIYTVYICTYLLDVGFNIDPPNTDLQIIVNEICVNDFSASWTPVSNEEGLSYNVTLSGPGLMNENVINSTMNIFHNFTRLSPNTTYTISVVSELDSCPGIPSTEMVTTLTESEGVPQRKIVAYLL